MAKKITPLLAPTTELLRLFGERLRLARKRRRLTAREVAKRAGMAPMTLRSLERGGSGVTMGAYLSVMQVLGIERDIELVAKADPVGRELQDAQLSISRKRRARPVVSDSQSSPVAAAAPARQPTRNLASAQARGAADAQLPEAAIPPLGEAKVRARRGLSQMTDASLGEHLRGTRKAAPGERVRGTPKEHLPSAPDASPQEQLRMVFEPPLDELVPPASKHLAQANSPVEEPGFADSSDSALSFAFDDALPL